MALEVVEYLEGEDGPQVKAKNGNDVIVVEHLAPPGCDAPPLPGDFVGTADGPGSGAQQAVGYHDPKNDGKAKPGENRQYARDANGAVIGWLWAKDDGTVVLENEQGKIELKPNGDSYASGNLKVEKDLEVGGNLTVKGEIKADLEVTAMAGGPGVKVSTHLHNSPFGPVSPPTPGT